MKKKFLIIAMVLAFLIPFVSPLGSAFAYDGGLLHGKVMQKGKDGNFITSLGTTSLFTDGDINTKGDIAYSGYNYGGDTYWYEFDSPVSIDGFYISELVSGVVLKLIDSNGVQIGNNYPLSSTSGINEITQVDNVKKVVITNTMGTGKSLGEFDVFSPVSTPVDSGDLLTDKNISVGSVVGTEISSTGLITDTDLTTTFGMTTGTDTEKMWYTFAEPIEVTDYRIDLTGTVQLRFVHSNGSETTVAAPTYNSKVSYSLTDVKSVYLYETSSSSTIKEFSIYGNSYVDIVSPSEVSNFVINPEIGQASLSWVNPSDSDFSGTRLYIDGALTYNYASNIDSALVTGLVEGQTYEFKMTTVDGSGNESVGVTQSVTIPTPDLAPPSNVTGVDYSFTDTTVTMSYVLPLDEDFSHVEIFKNNTLIQDDYSSTSFSDTTLIPNTQYTFNIVSVDISGNKSVGYPFTFTTSPEIDVTPPTTPSEVTVVEGNEALHISWTPSNDPDIQGYNVYVNGVQSNTEPVMGSSYTVTGLDNETEYDVQVTSVDTSGNESAIESSVAVVASPTVNAMPVFSTDYDLADVSQGVGNWFSSLWLVVAFAVAIPLSFYIARKVKGLFIR